MSRLRSNTQGGTCFPWTPELPHNALGFSLLHKCPTKHIFTLYGEFQHASWIWTPKTCIKAVRTWRLLHFFPPLRTPLFPSTFSNSCCVYEVHLVHNHSDGREVSLTLEELVACRPDGRGYFDRDLQRTVKKHSWSSGLTISHPCFNTEVSQEAKLLFPNTLTFAVF
jgi:putative component of membrane protein insertase Oxa1/YidC/SpoIIIJ protein YidD